MTYRDRTAESLMLYTPSGTEYEAKWAGDDITLEKRVAQFNYPGINGTVVQDQGSNGFLYPLTFHFTGDDHDTITSRLKTALKDETGLWTIIHPVEGVKYLQLLSSTISIQTVEHENITFFTTQWIEPILEELVTNDISLETEISNNIEIINELVIEQFDFGIIQDQIGRIEAIKTAIKNSIAIISKNYKALTSTITSISSAFNSIQRGINDTLDAVFVEPFKLIAQVQALIELPGLISSNFEERFNVFKNSIDELLDNTPEGNTQDDYNTVLTYESVVTSILAQTPYVASTSDFELRTEAVSASIQVQALFNSVTEKLDEIQGNFDDVDIDNQYFSQSQSYMDTLKSNALMSQLLISKTFDLKIQREIILDQAKTPIAITIEEYGELGENDSNYELFLSSNNLSGDDILLLPAGRKVVVYG